MFNWKVQWLWLGELFAGMAESVKTKRCKSIFFVWGSYLHRRRLHIPSSKIKQALHKKRFCVFFGQNIVQAGIHRVQWFGFRFFMAHPWRSCSHIRYTHRSCRESSSGKCERRRRHLQRCIFDERRHEWKREPTETCHFANTLGPTASGRHRDATIDVVGVA